MQVCGWKFVGDNWLVHSLWVAEEEGGGADTTLKTKPPDVNVGKNINPTDPHPPVEGEWRQHEDRTSQRVAFSRRIKNASRI